MLRPTPLAVLALLAACGGGSAEAPAPAAVATGSVAPAQSEPEPAPDPAEQARPGEALPTPPLPFAIEEASPAMRRAWEAVVAVWALPRAEQPAEASLEVVNAWASQVFAPWMRERRHAVEEARVLLVDIPRDEVAEQVVARAMLGLLWEDLARDSALGTPVPEEVQPDEELRGVFLGTLHEQLAPLRARAMGLYAQCVSSAEGAVGPLEEWARFCEERLAEVRAWHAGPPLEPTVTPGSWMPAPPGE